MRIIIDTAMPEEVAATRSVMTAYHLCTLIRISPDSEEAHQWEKRSRFW